MTVFLSLLFFSWGQNLNLPYSVLEGKRTYGKKNFKRKAKIHTHQESQELCLSSINLTDGSFNQESQELCLSSINLTDRSFKPLLSLCSEFMQFALPVVSSFFFFFFSCLFVLFSESEIKNWIQELFLNAEGILSHGTELDMSCSHNFIVLYGVLCPDGHIESSVFPKLLTVVPQ